MTDPAEIQAELSEITRVLGEFEAVAPAEWSAEWINMQSLRRRQVEALDELRLSRGEADVMIAMSGGAESGHSVQAGFFGHFVTDLQAALGALTQTVMHGARQASRGTLPADVVRASTLRVVGTSTGSLVLLLDGPVGRGTQTTIEGEDEMPPFEEAISKILDVLDSAATGQEDALETVIADIGSHRALSHIDAMANSLARSQTSATISLTSPLIPRPREARLSPDRALSLHGVLSRTRQETVTERVRGRLSGVLWRRNIFELETVEEPSRLLHGRIISDLREAVQPHFDTVVTVELEVITTAYADDQTRTTYRLVGIDDDYDLGLTRPAIVHRVAEDRIIESGSDDQEGE